VATADALKAAIDGLATSHPTGVSLILDDDQSEDIRTQLSDLRNRALIAAVIVLLVLLAFLRSARAAIVVFATVAFSVLITVNVMYFAGFSLNLLTLMGLAMGFGLVVDNAIVVLENTYRRRKEGDSALDAARRGAGDVVIPILAATGTTLVVLVPFVYLQGELRIFYVPLALVVGIALAASLFVAFTFIPALAARLLGAVKPAEYEETPGNAPANATVAAIPPALRKSLPVRGYASLIGLSLRMPWVTVLIAVAMLGGSWYLFDTYVSRNRIWNFGGQTRDYITININQPRGEELERTDELARFFEARLRRMPEVEQFVSNIQARRGIITVYFPDSLQYTGIPPAIKEQMVQHSLLFGGTDVRVYGYGPSFYGGGGGASPNYTVKVLGYNYEQVRLIAEDIGRRLERFSRIREVDTNSSGRFTRDKATEIVVDIDRARIGLYDLTSQQVVNYVSAAVREGQSLGGTRETVRVGGEEMALSVTLADSRTMDVLRLEDLLMPTSTSRAGVRLRDVATIREREVLNQVVRENQQYQRNVSYEFRGPAKLGDVTLETVLGSLALPPGYSVDRGQLWSWSVEEAKQIWGVIAIAIVLIFMVTAAVFESIKQPFCVLLTVPMALIGVFLIFFYTGASFTREGYVGVIMMSGIVVNSAILLVDHVNQLRRRQGMPLEDALIRGTIERVRPILMTGLTTICGLLPLVLFSTTADANIWNALAYVVIGGLGSSTILVLTVTPALYKIFERRAERKRLAELADTPGPEALPAPA
jgi:HAE1 family hydrophobic/amphiphilic exporter-1